MTAALATLNDHTITKGKLTSGAWGLWWADLDLSEEIALSGPAIIRIGDLTANGTIFAGGAIHGRAAYRVVGGSGGWGKTIARRGYANDLGLLKSKILADAARDAGETIDLTGMGDRLGPAYVRREGAACDVLHQLSPRAWFVGYDGITRIGSRPAVTLQSDAPRTRVDLLRGVIELATEEISKIAPGISVDGSPPATDVEFEIAASRVTARIYFKGETARRLGALARIVDAFTQDLKYAGHWEFRVVRQVADRFDLQPVRIASGMPDLRAVPVRPGAAGLRGDVTPGELVLVVFADRDPSRPCIVAHDAPDAPGWMPLTIELGGPGAAGIARIGDTVQAGPYAGVITSGSARVKAAI